MVNRQILRNYYVPSIFIELYMKYEIKIARSIFYQFRMFINICLLFLISQIIAFLFLVYYLRNFYVQITYIGLYMKYDIVVARSIFYQFRMFFNIYLLFLISQKIACFSLVYCLLLLKEFTYLCYSILSLLHYDIHDVFLPQFCTNALKYLIYLLKYFTILMPYYILIYNVLLKIIFLAQYNIKYA